MKRTVLAIALLSLLSLLFWTRSRAEVSADFPIYTDQLPAGWQDWSWDATVALGTQIDVTYTAPWGSLYLHPDAALDTTNYTHIRFEINGRVTGGQFVQFKINDATLVYDLHPTANTWTQIDVPLTALGNPATISAFYWQDGLGAAQPLFSIDNVRLVNANQPAATFLEPNADMQANFGQGPSGVAIAPNGRLYVAAWRENRIYSWANALDAPNMSADLVFGTGDYLHNADNGCFYVPDSDNFCGPESVAVDAANNLYVADTYGNRVQIFFHPDSDATPLSADLSLGANVPLGFSAPRGLVIDSANQLWVVDEYHHRVLQFVDPIGTDGAPDLVLGQNSLNDGASTLFNIPLGVTADGANNIYVTDLWNNRLLRFDAPVANMAAASQTYDNITNPHDVAIDAAGMLYVSSAPTDQILVYQNPLSDTSADDRSLLGLDNPMGLAFDALGNLYVANCGAPYPCDNPSELLIFYANTPPTSTETPTPTPTETPMPTPTETPMPTPTDTPMPNPNRAQLQIDLSAPSHSISPYIYGVHFIDEAFATEIALPVRRWGGNDTTRYNWKNDATSSALDWYFVNKSADMTMSNFLARNQRTSTASLITMPMTGWVAKDNSNGTCGFSTAKYNYAPLAWASHGMATATAPFFPQCGTGIIGFNGSGYPIFYNNIAGTDGEGLPIFQAAVDPNDTSIPFGSADATEWVTSLVGQYGSAENGGVPFYALDNEPDIWWQSHPDVAPIGYNYDDFVARSQEYAAAIKAGDPSAQVLGPVVSNWAYFFNSFYDGQREDWATPNDRTAHGGVPFLEWYLQQMQAYETQTGVRLLDYLDVHFYPQSGQYNSTAGNSAAQALRLRSTQSLWNPTYQDESWIGSTGIDGGVVQLIPRLRQLVDQNYPGTKTAITEYSWGSHESLNGALTQADILGIFGREGLDFATLFDSVYENAASRFQPDRPSAYAFRVYRNYDGNGSQFGDLSISATSMLNGVDNQNNLAIYAAQRSSDNVLTLVVINKTANPISADLSLVGLARNSQAVAADSATVYRYSAADLTAIANEGTIALAQNQLTADYPANSITLLAVPLVAQTPTGIGRLLSEESESPNRWIIVALVLVGLSWVTVKLWSQRFGR